MPTTTPLTRRDSWPPTLISIETPTSPSSMDIDANPFSYFLSPSTSYDDDVDDLIDIDLSAGIESDEEPSIEVREVSPSSIQNTTSSSGEATGISRVWKGKSKREKDMEKRRVEEEMTAWLQAPLSLRDFQANQTSPSKRKAKSASTSPSSSFTAQNRGRGVVRLTPNSRGTRVRSRSAVSARPHSWRLPSPEIGSIREEDEDVEMSMDEKEWREDTPGLVSDAGISEVEQEPEVPRKRAKVDRKEKRVRWAMPERWEID